MHPNTHHFRDQRARQLDIIDDVIRTAKEQNRNPTAEEKSRHDAAVILFEHYDELERSAGTSARSGSFPVPNVNVRGSDSVGADVTRNLDSILWATNETVRAGEMDKAGNVRPNAFGAVNPVEQVVIRSDVGASGSVAPRLTEFRADHRDAIRSFQKTVSDMIFFGLLIDKHARSSAQGFEVARSHRLFKDRYASILRAMDVDTSGEGGTWVPTGIGASMHEKVRAAGKVAPLFARIDIPTNPWKWPVEGGDLTAYRVGEPTGDTETKVAASTPGTIAATFDAEIFGARSLFSRSLEADSALAILPFYQRKMIQAFVTAEERAILDGDTDGTHMDADVHALGTTDARWAWDGLRKRALAQTTQATTATTSANLAAIRKSMGKWGVNPADLAYIIGVSGYHALMTDTNLITVDKFGPNATILNGQIGSIFGIPVIISEYVREDLNASGVQDAITTTKTYNLCVNRNEWVMGQRMALDIEVDDSIYRETFQRVAVAFMREDFQSVAEAATDDTTSIGINVTSGS